MAEARDTRAARRSSWSWPQFGAMAASLAIGVIAGPALLGSGSSDGSLVIADASGLSTSPALAAVLDTAASGDDLELAGLGTVQVDLSFRDLDSNLCRQVRLSQGAATSDLLACRSGDGWQIEALGTRAANVGEVRTASGDAAPAVVAAVDAIIDSDPLVGAEEQAALRR